MKDEKTLYRYRRTFFGKMILQKRVRIKSVYQWVDVKYDERPEQIKNLEEWFYE